MWAGSGAAGGQARLAEFGAAKVYVADSPDYDDYVVAPKAELLAELVGQDSPAAVLVAATSEGREVAARLAVKTGSGILTDVVGGGDGLAGEQSIFGGAITVQSKVRTGTPIIAVRPNAITPEPAERRRRARARRRSRSATRPRARRSPAGSSRSAASARS